jgi:hypothetical protein
MCKLFEAVDGNQLQAHWFNIFYASILQQLLAVNSNYLPAGEQYKVAACLHHGEKCCRSFGRSGVLAFIPAARTIMEISCRYATQDLDFGLTVMRNQSSVNIAMFVDEVAVEWRHGSGSSFRCPSNPHTADVISNCGDKQTKSGYKTDQSNNNSCQTSFFAGKQ